MRHQTKFLFKISQQKRNDQDGSKINTHTHTYKRITVGGQK